MLGPLIAEHLAALQIDVYTRAVSHTSIAKVHRARYDTQIIDGSKGE